MKPIEVDVFGQRLTLQGDGDEGYVQELAQYRSEEHTSELQSH